MNAAIDHDPDGDLSRMVILLAATGARSSQVRRMRIGDVQRELSCVVRGRRAGLLTKMSSRPKRVNYTLCMFLNDHPPIAGGRELWGFPKKLAGPTLRTETDTLVGTLDYGPVRVATSTMGYKYKEADAAATREELAAPNFLLKIIPQVDGSPRICELVQYHLEEIDVKGVWSGPGETTTPPPSAGRPAAFPLPALPPSSRRRSR